MAEPSKIAEEALEKVAAHLECGICCDEYKSPKLLSCFHVFCKQCLERLVQKEDGQSILQCPNCRRATALPLEGVSGLPSDFHAHHLFEIQEMLKKVKEPQKTKCEKCDTSTATGFCRDCGQFVCESCTEMHKTWVEYSTHQIVTMQDIQAGAASLIPPKKKVLYCQQHEEKLLELYCETCSELICHNCTIQVHQGHRYSVASDTFKKHKQEIADQLEPVQRHIASINQALKTFDCRSKQIQDQKAAVKADINKQIDQLQQTLEQMRAELIGQLDQLTQHKLKSLAAQRDQVELLHTQLSSCDKYVQDSLKTGTQGVILKMKVSMLKQIGQITTDFNPDMLVPEEEADILLVADTNLHDACEKFAVVISQNMAYPEKCYPTGNGLKSATLGQPTTVIVHTISKSDKECQHPVKGLAAELVNCKDETKIECQVSREGDSKYKIQYTPATRGQHLLHIKIDGRNIKGSPYTVVAIPPIQNLDNPVRAFGNIQSPWGIAANSKGQIIVAENSRHCISVFTPEGNKVRSFGSQGNAQGQLYIPCGVAVDRDDNIIVSDFGNQRIQKFTSEGKFLMTVGSSGTGQLQFKGPTGTGISTDGKLYVSEESNHRIQILNTDLTFSSSFGSNGSGDGQFSNPYDIAFDSTNNIYIVDASNHRIQVFTPEGKFLRKFGSHGSGDGQLNCPWSIAVDRNDTVYVADYNNSRISIFTTHGQFQRSFGSKYVRNPQGVAIDKDGFILVADKSNNQIQIF